MTSIAADSWEEQATEIHNSRKERETHTLDLPGKGRHVLTLLHNGQSARTEIHVIRAGVGIARADLPLRNAARHGREPHDLEHLMRRAGKNREFMDRVKELRGVRPGISVRAWYGLANR